MNKPVRYNGLIQCWFTEDGDIVQQAEENAVFGTWMEDGYKTDATLDNVTDEWLEHWNLNDGIIERANPAAVLGRRGGKSTSDAKRKASAENGKKGGRPKTKK